MYNYFTCEKCGKIIDVDTEEGIVFYTIVSNLETSIDAKCSKCIIKDEDQIEITKLSEHIRTIEKK